MAENIPYKKSSAWAGHGDVRNRTAGLADIAALVRADLACLRPIVTRLACRAVIQPLGDEATIVLCGNRDAEGTDSFRSALSIPVIDPFGMEAGKLELHLKGRQHSDREDCVLASILETAELAVTERWFRVHHRRRWLLGARCIEADVPRWVFLALDRERRVVGASRGRQGMIDTYATSGETPPALSAFFTCSLRRFRASQRDQFLTLSSNEGRIVWNAVLTPPDLSPNERLDGEKLILHTRPRSHLIELYRQQSRDSRASAGLPRRVLSQVQARIEAQLSGALKIDTLAAWAGMSVSKFARSFLSSVGVSPHLYIMQRRLLKAQDLLEHSDLPLSQIALETGFADQSHFSRRFHQEAGMPPLRYRSMHQSLTKGVRKNSVGATPFEGHARTPG